VTARGQKSRNASGRSARGTQRSAGPSIERSLPPATYWAVLGGIVAAGAAARLLAARGELWLDEIWSLRFAQMIASRVGVFTELHHDNNHHLNTFYLSWIGETSVWILYRLHSLAAGIGTIVLAAVIARRAGDRAALTAGLFTSGSFLLILYSSEARGYSLAVFFAFLAVVMADRAQSTGRLWWAWAGGFGLVSTLGILSHLTFLHAYVGLVAWTGWRGLQRPRQPHWPRQLAALHLIPLAGLAALYWVDLRHMVIGGGPPFTVVETVARTLSLAIGGPVAGSLRGLMVIAAIVLAVASIVAVRRSGSNLWILFAATLMAPAVMLATVPTSVLFERYFLVATACALLSAGWLAAIVARRSRLVWWGLVALFLIGNASQTWRLIERGRGSYVPAVTHMVTEARRKTITVGSNHDFRVGRVLAFHLSFVPGGERIRYQPAGTWTPAGPEWLLRQSKDADFVPELEITTEGGRQYTLERVYRSAGLSEWHLALYRNQRAPNR